MICVQAVIAEDEKYLRLNLKMMLERLWPALHICGEVENGKDALDIIEQKNPDIAFLDIKMPEISGLEVAKKIYDRTLIVFVTAYDDYAIEAFESEALDYLLKPVTKERLEKTIHRLKRQLKGSQDTRSIDLKMKRLLEHFEHKPSQERLQTIKVKCGLDIRFLPMTHIYFFKAEDKYTMVQTARSEYIIRTPIKDLEKMIDPEQFWRIHRSTLVNIEKIERVKRSFRNRMVIAFHGIEKTVNVSRAFEHLFKHM